MGRIIAEIFFCETDDIVVFQKAFFLGSQRNAIYQGSVPVFRRSTRKFPAFLFFSFFVSSSVPRFFLYLQQIFNALSGLFLLEKFF